MPGPTPGTGTAPDGRPGRCTACCARSSSRSTPSPRTRSSSAWTTGPPHCAATSTPTTRRAAEKDAELVDQLDRAGALLDALGLATLTPPGLEADDVNATAATWAVEHGWNCVLITSDRDSFAHISEHTSVLRLLDGGINGSPLLTPQRLQILYGVPAERYLEFAAVRGDASDNLPGIRGIGEKTAALLLAQMGSMQAVWADVDHNGGEALVAALDSLAAETGGRRTSTSILARLSAPEARQRYEFNMQLMSGRTDLDLGLTPDVPGTPGLLPLDVDRVQRVVGHLNFEATTALAIRVLTGDPASANRQYARSARPEA